MAQGTGVSNVYQNYLLDGLTITSVNVSGSGERKTITVCVDFAGLSGLRLRVDGDRTRRENARHYRSWGLNRTSRTIESLSERTSGNTLTVTVVQDMQGQPTMGLWIYLVLQAGEVGAGTVGMGGSRSWREAGYVQVVYERR